MKFNDFDRVAKFYDALAQLIFGKSLKQAQSHFINKIPDGATILVLGSGTGWIAEEILKQKPNSKITLVDASQKMTALARKMLIGKPVEILCADQTKIFTSRFDVIILPCYLDLFPDQKIKNVLRSINRNASEDSTWIVTDFVSKKLWQRIYLWVMYRFFKWTSNIEASQLPNWENAMSFNNFEIREEKKFYSGFMKTAVYKRTKS